MNKKTIFITLLIIIMLLCSCTAQQGDDTALATPSAAPAASAPVQTLSPTPQPVQQEEPEPDTVSEPVAKYVFMFIGDGMGEAHKELSEEYLKYVSNNADAQLALNQMSVNTMVPTYSANAGITDSAAAATALATGVKTNNGIISQTPDGEELKTILEALSEIGYATGVITTTRLTHATPACFYAHNDYRTNETEIALDLLDSGVNFIAGGGMADFLPEELPERYASLGTDIRGMPVYTYRSDDIDLVSRLEDAGYTAFLAPEETESFLEYAPQQGDRIFAPLAYNYFPYEIDRIFNNADFPSLADMTKQAIRFLSLDEDGFFLMVEGGRIDYAAHNNDALGVIYDTLAFDNAVRTALDFYIAHPYETLIITTADHETGGLTLDPEYDYTEGFKNVEGIFSSYGDGFALVYDYEKSFEEFIEGIRALGLELTADETDDLREAFEQIEYIESYEEAVDTTPSLVLSNILNSRIGVSWTSSGHTSADVALGVTGVFEDRFADASDNTDIANILADILDVDIGL